MNTKETVDALLRFVEIVVSWPVIVAALCIILRKPIAAFLPDLSKRLRKAEIGEAKFEFAEVKTLETPVGKANVSAIPARATRAVFEGFYSTYLSAQQNYRISWPRDTWSASVEKGRALSHQLGLPATVSISLIIEKNEAVGEFRPNVNVTVESSVGATSIEQYMISSKKVMEQQGWIVLSSSADKSTQGGLLVYLNTSFEKKVYQCARIVLSAGVAYVVTASQLPTDDLMGQQLKDELVNILNSFQVVV